MPRQREYNIIQEFKDKSPSDYSNLVQYMSGMIGIAMAPVTPLWLWFDQNCFDWASLTSASEPSVHLYSQYSVGLLSSTFLFLASSECWICEKKTFIRYYHIERDMLSAWGCHWQMAACKFTMMKRAFHSPRFVDHKCQKLIVFFQSKFGKTNEFVSLVTSYVLIKLHTYQ